MIWIFSFFYLDHGDINVTKVYWNHRWDLEGSTSGLFSWWTLWLIMVHICTQFGHKGFRAKISCGQKWWTGGRNNEKKTSLRFGTSCILDHGVSNPPHSVQGTVGFRNARKGTNIAAQAAAIALAEVSYAWMNLCTSFCWHSSCCLSMPHVSQFEGIGLHSRVPCQRSRTAGTGKHCRFLRSCTL